MGKKSTFNKTVVLLLFFLLIFIGLLIFSWQINNKKTTYKSEASTAKILVWNYKYLYKTNNCTGSSQLGPSNIYNSLGQCASAIGSGSNWRDKINTSPQGGKSLHGKCNNYGTSRSYKWICYEVAQK